ncbi:hypothetical protein [Xenorhabdus griffiniae]|uniref:DNA-binding protein n=1 Tax=Xenorhabdus griffiniae TaxID=351672 RepID=A0ABY9XKY6_9GAMM|nr:hypothetical protein [Xenorhabdus griffiniae]MBD1229371.1 hypothetical protein [Xenorhabdus griffiniae]MBE8589124.1 hypothetical protein [Xenorhabdus griffiniae]WMV73607.1 hypothetical protein QL128_06195 [Xenorhabdus griffiniae]WNH03287.1 hypothetical protein QL112_006200 [Xenorhabdus griffiniae]
MQTTNAINAKHRWVTYPQFCERAEVSLRTAKYYVASGKVKIKPKKKPGEKVYIDWLDWNNG